MAQATKPDQALQSPLLSLRDVRKTYADGQVQALAGVSFDIQPGQFVSVMGPSGCGKSTLLNILGALDRPTSGEVLFDGSPLERVQNLDQLRAQRIGFVFQSFYLLPNLTALENVQLPMFEGNLSLAERPGRAEQLLSLVGLQDRLRHLPYQLSIGQRQRVAIARALANQPSLILADEPTGSLDADSVDLVHDLFAEARERTGLTLVLVTHDQGLADRMDRRVRMTDGRLVT